MSPFKAILILAVAAAAVHGNAVNNQKVPLQRGGRVGSGPGDTPISVTPPNLFVNIAVDAVPGPFFQDFQPPFPTDVWWSGATVGTQDANLAGPFPFQSATRDTGLVFGVSTNRNFDGASLQHPTQLDWSLGFAESTPDIFRRKAVSWDTQVLCLTYNNAAGSSAMDSCLVPGSPYFTVTYTNAQVRAEALTGDISEFAWITQGTKARVTTTNGGTYLIYVVGGALDLVQDGPTTLQSSPGFSGTVRFAKLTDPGQEAILDQHQGTWAVGLDASYQVAGDTGTQIWTWLVEGNPADLLILSWPHHRTQLQNPNYVDIDYLTLKGHMRGVVGNQWTLQLALPTVSWFAPRDPQASCLGELIKTLEVEVRNLQVMVPGDFYFWGGSFGRAAQLATIAEHVGRTDLVDQVVEILRASIEYWFDPTHVPAAAYEPGWGGFINGDGWNNTWVDFGNAYYNDHHFHYGYLLHGAAVLGRYDPAWLNQHLDFLLQVARDIGNPSPTDPHYTVVRHLDWFAGHSWASGIANGAGPRDQESSGEAINGFYGLLLFANAINNPALIDFARLLVAIEIHGAQTYWQLHPNRQDADGPYPEQEFRDLSSVGNVMDWQTGAWLFWGDQRTEIAAIQILPLTPIGHYTYDVDWIQSVVPFCQAELDDLTIGDAFKSVIYAAFAKVNPQQAFGFSEDLFDWGTGNSATNQLYFIATQESGADICGVGTQTPEGEFYIQDAATNLYVSATGGGQLHAQTPASVLATKFQLTFTPGGSTILDLNNGLFATASPDGTQAVAAIRDTAQAYETFRWNNIGDGTYELTAMVNRVVVTIGAEGELVNNGGAAARFRLTPVEEQAPVPVPASGQIRNVNNNNLVGHTEGDPVLRADGAVAPVTWFFEQVPEENVDPPNYTIRSGLTNNYVTADIGGTQPLAAIRAEAAAWEYFQIIGYQGNFLIIHQASGNLVTLQGDLTLIDNSNVLEGVTEWSIV